MVFDCLTAAGEGILVDLCLDLLGGVVQEDGRLRQRRAHLCVVALQRWEELGVDKCRLDGSEFGRNVARQSEVRVLVDSAGNEAGNGVVGGQHDREGRRQGRRGLDGGETMLADVVRVGKAKNRLSLVVGRGALHAQHIRVELGNVAGRREYERIVRVKADGDDVARIFARQVLVVLQGRWRLVALGLLREEELLVVGHLDDDGALQGALQEGGKDEGHEMANVHGGGRGAAASVEEDGEAGLEAVEDVVQVSVREEDGSAEEDVGAMAGDGFEAGEEFGGDGAAPELDNELFVVNAAGDFPRSDDGGLVEVIDVWRRVA